MQNPRIDYWNVVIRIPRYLKKAPPSTVEPEYRVIGISHLWTYEKTKHIETNSHFI